jgi:hypothetical protein
MPSESHNQDERRGFRTQTIYNALGQIAQIQDLPAQNQNEISQVHQFELDANGNVKQERVWNQTPIFVDGLPNGQLTTGSWVTTQYLYDLLDHRLQSDVLANGTHIITKYRYDRVGNLILTLLPEFVPGNQDTANVVSTFYGRTQLTLASYEGRIVCDLQGSTRRDNNRSHRVWNSDHGQHPADGDDIY